jgi:death-on-curing protein
LPKNRKDVIRLDAEAVQRVHDEMVSFLWPGFPPVERGGCRDRGLLDSAVNRPFQSAFGEDAYPDLLEKGAALFHSLVANHCFTDGNKRTAAVTLESFLIANAVAPLFTNQQIYDVARNAASHHARGISAKRAYEEILEELRGKTIPFATLRAAKSQYPRIGELYSTMAKTRRTIRRTLRMMANEPQRALPKIN